MKNRIPPIIIIFGISFGFAYMVTEKFLLSLLSCILGIVMGYLVFEKYDALNLKTEAKPKR